MKKILAVGAAVLGGLILVWLLLTLGISHPAAQPTPSEYIAREAMAQATATAVVIAGDEALRQAEQNADRDRWVQPAITLLMLVAIVAAMAFVVLAVAGSALAAWHRRRPLILVAGEPVARRLVEQGDYPSITYDIVRARGVAEIEAARRPVYPQTYSPHISDSRKYDNQLPAPQAQASITQDVPTFAALLNSGRIAPGTPLLMGYEGDGKEQTGATSDLFSMIISGVSGSGKTNTTAVLLTQAYLTGAGFVVCDPHSEAEEDSLTSLIAPLEDAFVLPVATSYAQILQAVQFVHDVMRARLAPSTATARQRARVAMVGSRPLLLIIDEANTVLSNSQVGDKVTELLTEIYSEGRKVKVYGASLAQSWLAARSGGSSALRDTAASKYVHRLPRKAAGLLLPTDLAPKCEYLPTGAAMLARRDGSFTTVTMPLITAADIIRAAAILRGAAQAMPTSPPTSNPPTNAPSSRASYRVIDATLEGSTEGLPEGVTHAQISLLAALMVEGAKQAEKLTQVFGCTAPAGREYQAACAKLRLAESYIARRAGIVSKGVQQ